MFWIFFIINFMFEESHHFIKKHKKKHFFICSPKKIITQHLNNNIDTGTGSAHYYYLHYCYSHYLPADYSAYSYPYSADRSASAANSANK